MRRREFITLIGSAAAWPLTGHAQQRGTPVIGYVSSLTKAHSVRSDAALRRGLSEMGYVEGQNVSIQYHWITDRYDEMPAMVADLVQRHVDVILAIGPPAVIAAQAATQTTPIVFVTGADPLKFGFVASFNKPGGNLTGIWTVLTTLAEKRLQLLHDLLPKAEQIGLLVNPSSPVAEPQIRETQAAAHALGVRITVLKAVTENDLDQVFASFAEQRADALLVSADSRWQHNFQCRRSTNFASLSKPADLSAMERSSATAITGAVTMSVAFLRGRLRPTCRSRRWISSN